MNISFAIATNVQGYLQAVVLPAGCQERRGTTPPAAQEVPRGRQSSLSCREVPQVGGLRTGSQERGAAAAPPAELPLAVDLPSSPYRLSGNHTSSSSTVQSLKGGKSATSQPESKTLVKGRDEMNA